MGDRQHYNSNHCSALDCTHDAPNSLFCRRHRAMVPKDLGDALRREVLEGRSHGPTHMLLIQAAVQSVAAVEGRRFYKLPEFHQ